MSICYPIMGVSLLGLKERWTYNNFENVDPIRLEIHQFNTNKKVAKLGFNNTPSVNLKPHGPTSSFKVIFPTLMQTSTPSLSFMISI